MDRIETLTLGEALSCSALKKIVYYMRRGGCVITPSDTCFSLACLPFNTRHLSVLSVLLERQNEPISLSFGTYKMMQDFVEITAEDERVADTLLPGPLTLVCKIKSTIPEERRQRMAAILHSDGTIGARLSDSAIERQISSELETPITTCAIRDDNGSTVTTFVDAVDIMRTRQESHNLHTPIIGVDVRKVQYERHSTVVTLQKDDMQGAVHIYRHGEIEPETIHNCVRQLTWSDYENNT